MVLRPVSCSKVSGVTNCVAAAGSDRSLKIAPPRRLSLEQALEYIEDDELVEVTPQNIRLRKLYLTELERRRRRNAATAAEEA